MSSINIKKFSIDYNLESYSKKVMILKVFKRNELFEINENLILKTFSYLYKLNIFIIILNEKTNKVFDINCEIIMHNKSKKIL